MNTSRLYAGDKPPDDTGRINNLFELYEHFEYSNPDTAIAFCEEALQISTNAGLTGFQAKALYYLGGLFDNKGEYQNAYNHYFKALKLFELQNDKKGIGGCLNCIGVVLWEQCEQATGRVKKIKLKKALEYIDKGLDYYKAIDYKKGMAVCFMNKGIVFNDYALVVSDTAIRNWRYRRAIENYGRAISLFKEIDDTRSISDCYLNIALLYYDMYFSRQDSVLTTDEYNTVKGYLDIAMDYYSAAGDLYGISMVLNDQATIKIDYADMKIHGDSLIYSAIADAAKALKFAEEVEAIILKYDALLTLYKAYKRLGVFDKALYFHEQYVAAKDSVHKTEQLKAVEEIEARYNTEKKEQKIISQEKENRLQRIIIIIVLAFLILIIILSIVLFRINKQKKYANIALNRKNNELAELNDTQNKIMSIISHDLKAPLSAFHSITRTLKSKFSMLSHQEIEIYFNRMLNSSLALKLQLENILNWSVTQSSKITVKKENLNLFAIVEKTVFILNEFAKEKRITIKNSIDEAVTVSSDKQLLSIVLNNLISNAIKFSEYGGLIEINTVTTENSITISITDYGEGMEQEQLKGLFSKHTAGKHKNSGTGLGLLVSYEIVTKLGGKISAQSKSGQGSTFNITLYG